MALAKRPLRRVWERKELYDIVMSLYNNGMSYNEIIKTLLVEHRIRIRKSHISDWVNGKHHPYGSTYEFQPTPSPELGYLIGVAKGDGSVRIQKWNHRVRLRVIDKDFAEEFDRCASSVLRSPRHAITWLPKQGLWCVEILSVLLVRLLEGPFPKLIEIVSHCDDCTAGFLRGFFDSEASISRRCLTLSNGNLRIMILVRKLLKRLRILTTGPRLSQKGGRLVVIKGRIYHANKNIYVLYVRAMSLQEYAARVGFSVMRKRMALFTALRGDLTNRKRT